MSTPLPGSGDFPKASITKDGFHAKFLDVLSFLSGLLGTDGTAASARTQLGLGSAATKNTGASPGNIPLWEHTLLNGVSAKSAGYTVVAGDRGKLIDATTGTWTLSLTAAATLGVGFAFGVRNSGSGTITVDPNSTEQIDGATTITLGAGESCLVVCDGSAFKTVGKAVSTSNGQFQSIRVFTASGTWTKPAGLKRVKVTVVGAGGGGQAQGISSDSESGAAGGAAVKVIEAASLGATEAVTVGIGGAAGVGGGDSGNPGVDGGTSSFGAHCSATGGGGGGSVPVGGIGSGGNMNMRGADGQGGISGSAGMGGSSIFGGGGQKSRAGGAYGAGGGAAGGAGAAGIVIVEEFF